MTSLKTLLYWRKYFLPVKPLLVTRTITLDVDLRESIYHESGLNIHTSCFGTFIFFGIQDKFQGLHNMQHKALYSLVAIYGL